MRIFFKSPKWDEVFQINGRLSVVRSLTLLLFWVWGLLGFAMNLVEFSRMSSQGSVGIGSSGYFTAQCLVWIGGMIFFGLATVISGRELSVMKKAVDEGYGDVRVSR